MASLLMRRSTSSGGPADIKEFEVWWDEPGEGDRRTATVGVGPASVALRDAADGELLGELPHTAVREWRVEGDACVFVVANNGTAAGSHTEVYVRGKAAPKVAKGVEKAVTAVLKLPPAERLALVGGKNKRALVLPAQAPRDGARGPTAKPGRKGAASGAEAALVTQANANLVRENARLSAELEQARQQLKMEAAKRRKVLRLLANVYAMLGGTSAPDSLRGRSEMASPAPSTAPSQAPGSVGSVPTPHRWPPAPLARPARAAETEAPSPPPAQTPPTPPVLEAHAPTGSGLGSDGSEDGAASPDGGPAFAASATRPQRPPRIDRIDNPAFDSPTRHAILAFGDDAPEDLVDLHNLLADADVESVMDARERIEDDDEFLSVSSSEFAASELGDHQDLRGFE